jgi:predicted dehydrogenase
VDIIEALNFALIGCGHIAAKHAQAIANIKEARLAAVCDTSPARSAPFRDKHGAREYSDYRQLLQDPGIDVVCICTPSGLHARMAVDAARAGKHVVVEKPLALTLANAGQIIDECRKAGVKLAVVHPNRFKPAVQALKKALDDGRFGTITHGSATVRWNRNQAYFDQDAWRGTKDLDGGALMNQAIHNIDLLQWMLGPVVEVFAYTTTRLRKIETEDLGVAALKFAGGALGIVEAATTLYPANLEETLAVFGETGTAVINGVTATELNTWRVAGYTEDEAASLKQAINSATAKPGHQVILEDLAEAIRTGREPLVNGEEGKKALAIILAIYRSARAGVPVRLSHAERGN